MSVEVLVWLAVGLAAGWLASTLIPGREGIGSDLLTGSVGALLGGMSFLALGLPSPFRGVEGAVALAFVGAVFLLLVLRAVRGARA